MVEFRRIGTTGTTESIIINMGPQHPSTHGVLHVVAEISGEQVLAAQPIIGYLHRGIEKLSEYRTYSQILVFCDRMDYVGGFSTELAYCRAVEKLAGIEVPKRGDYIRALFAELVRITSHLIWVGTYGLDLGAWTPLIYTFVERETIQDFFEEAAGSRMMPNYFRFGGVKEDLPDGLLDKMYRFFDEQFFKAVDDYEALLTANEIFITRTKGIGSISTKQALEWGVTGPMLRATGAPRDLRKDDPYSVYSQLDFKVCTAEGGDCFSRYRVRMDEIRESARMVMMLIEKMPEGEFRTKLPKTLKPPEGEVYMRTESPRGELGVYVVSDGTGKPYRLHFRSPAYANLSALPRMAPGWKLADLIAIVGSIDVVLGEIDR